MFTSCRPETRREALAWRRSAKTPSILKILRRVAQRRYGVYLPQDRGGSCTRKRSPRRCVVAERTLGAPCVSRISHDVRGMNKTRSWAPSSTSVHAGSLDTKIRKKKMTGAGMRYGNSLIQPVKTSCRRSRRVVPVTYIYSKWRVWEWGWQIPQRWFTLSGDLVWQPIYLNANSWHQGNVHAFRCPFL